MCDGLRLERQRDWKTGEKEKKNLAGDRSDIRVDGMGGGGDTRTCTHSLAGTVCLEVIGSMSGATNELIVL